MKFINFAVKRAVSAAELPVRILSKLLSGLAALLLLIFCT